MKKTTQRAALAAAILFSAACGSVDATYVQADRALYEVLAPAHRSYIEADPALDAERKLRRQRLLDSWDLRIRQAEAATK